MLLVLFLIAVLPVDAVGLMLHKAEISGPRLKIEFYYAASDLTRIHLLNIFCAFY